MKPFLRRAARSSIPAVLAAVAIDRTRSRRARVAAGATLVATWAAVYARYRRASLGQTAQEFDLLRSPDWFTYRYRYEEVFAGEEDLAVGRLSGRRGNEMRHELVADALRAHVQRGGRILDVGCGAATVADQVEDLDALYVGVDVAGPHLRDASKRYACHHGRLATTFLGGEAETLPFRVASFDVVVMSDTIGHLLRPDIAAWEVSRVLRPGGVLIMTTRNASEMPCKPPLSHLLPWLEKMLGATHPRLISLRPWVWPHPVRIDPSDPESTLVFLPHTHHIYEEMRRLFAAAGLDTLSWTTFEFPPPQSTTALFLEPRGEGGVGALAAVERVARATPGIRRLGCRLFMTARKVADPATSRPVPGVWPGPLLQRARRLSFGPLTRQDVAG